MQQFTLTMQSGTETRRVSRDTSSVEIISRQVTAISESIGQLTRVTQVNLYGNDLSSIPTGIFALKQLAWLNVCRRRTVV